MDSTWDEKLYCGVCGKTHRREDVDNYRYYRGELYCSTHPGVVEQYEGAIKIANEKLKLMGGSRG